jgi:hypothetical protein
MKIIDLAKEEPDPKKQIELLYCLKLDTAPKFETATVAGGYNASLPFFDTVERVALKAWKDLDLISLARKEDEFKCFFLGHWNDGVALENNIVIDNFGEVKKKKPIELVSCLQSSPSDKTGDNYFYKTDGEYSLKNANLITRVSKNVSDTEMDLIILNHGRGNTAWLGHWNAGVL